MKKSEIKIGGKYHCKVNGILCTVRVDSISRHGGWNGTNMNTNRPVRIRTAARLRAPVDIDVAFDSAMEAAMKEDESLAWTHVSLSDGSEE